MHSAQAYDNHKGFMAITYMGYKKFDLFSKIKLVYGRALTPSAAFYHERMLHLELEHAQLVTTRSKVIPGQPQNQWSLTPLDSLDSAPH